MADVCKAIDFMLRQEDATLSGTVTNAANDNGGCTRFGLCAKWHPALVVAGFFSPEMPRDKALLMAEDTYTKEYAPALRLAVLRSDAVACAVLSFAVVDGTGSALKLLRHSLDSLGSALPVSAAAEDDVTFTAENAEDEVALVPALVKAQEQRCAEIVARDPSQSKWLRGWTNRAQQVLGLVRNPALA